MTKRRVFSTCVKEYKGTNRLIILYNIGGLITVFRIYKLLGVINGKVTLTKIAMDYYKKIEIFHINFLFHCIIIT